MFADRKVIVTSMEQGLRVAGQVEIAETDDVPDWRRAEICANTSPHSIQNYQPIWTMRASRSGWVVAPAHLTVCHALDWPLVAQTSFMPTDMVTLDS